MYAVNPVPTARTSICSRTVSPSGSLIPPWRLTVVPVLDPPVAIGVVPSARNCARLVGAAGAWLRAKSVSPAALDPNWIQFVLTQPQFMYVRARQW